MPFKSEKQRRFMWAKHPEIAKRWAKEYGNKAVGGVDVEVIPKKIIYGGNMPDKTNDKFGDAASRRLAMIAKSKAEKKKK